MSGSPHTDDALLEQKIAAVVHQILQGEARRLIAEQLEGFVRENERRARELTLMERVVRVEEELKALREAQMAHFHAAEKRFEALQREMIARFEAMDKRFEASEKRFESLQREMDVRFEAMDKRFRMLQWFMSLGFSAVLALMTILKIFS
uniref:DUF1640 domain-containing protein n=1 Tax=Desulfacinum infernum TaxID=35837 RepID=A0A832A6F3_9BACT